MDALAPFSPKTRSWFEGTFHEPTPAQALGWPAIASGEHTLIQAPTGSGKTLAGVLYGVARLTPGPGAAGVGKDARRVPVRDPPAAPRAAAGPAAALRLASEGAQLRHRTEPARA